MTHVELFNKGKCYNMYFNLFNSTIQFKIIDHLDDGYKKAIICDTNKEFTFCSANLMNQEKESIQKVACGGCCKR